MVRIRLARFGRKHEAYFRIVVTPQREKQQSKAIEYVGTYSPHTKEITLKKDRIEYWLSNGAQPSETVQRILEKQGVLKPSKNKKVFKKAPGRKRKERLEQEAAEKESKETEKAPKEESTEEKKD